MVSSGGEGVLLTIRWLQLRAIVACEEVEIALATPPLILHVP